jgi:phosphonatase-like hydrolase
MAGTTVRDPGLVAAALAGALGVHGYTIDPAAAQPLMGYDKPEAIRRLMRDAGAVRAADDSVLVMRIHAEFVTQMLQCYRTDPRVEPMPEAEECFAALRARGIRIALNTAFSRSIADAIVTRFGWLENGIVDDLVATDEVPSGRPEPHMMRTLMARAGVDDPRAVVKIGDTEVDVREGRNVGAGLVVAVTTGAYSRAALEAYAPDRIIDSLRELPGLL